MYKNITLGADPEMFLRKSNGEYVPCIGVIGGTKKHPKMITDAGHAMQEDNVMVEFNIPPSSSKDEFINNLVFTMRYILDNVEEDLGLEAIPSVEFSEEDLEHPQAQMFGCAPFMNCYTRSEEYLEVSDSNIRYAGGHIHIGYDNPTMEASEKLVKALDMFLGLPSLLLDNDDRRRKTYGKAGMFRFKEYGLEYRSLSNFWLKSEELMGFVYDNTMKAIDFLEKGGEIPEGIREVINNNDKAKATELIHDFKIRKDQEEVALTGS